MPYGWSPRSQRPSCSKSNTTPGRAGVDVADGGVLVGGADVAVGGRGVGVLVGGAGVAVGEVAACFVRVGRGVEVGFSGVSVASAGGATCSSSVGAVGTAVAGGAGVSVGGCGVSLGVLVAITRPASASVAVASILATDAGVEILKPGDFAGFPAGSEDGHNLINRSDRDAVFLVVGSRREAEDAVHYSDVDMHLPNTPGEGRIAFTRKDGTPY